MLIRASGEIVPNLFQLTLGSSCITLFKGYGSILFDCGVSAQIPLLERRLHPLGLNLSTLTDLYITHLHPERIAALPYLKRRNPGLLVHGTEQISELLCKSGVIEQIYETDRQLREKIVLSNQPEILSLKDYSQAFRITSRFRNGEPVKVAHQTTLRPIQAFGHTDHSVSYLIEPDQILIADDIFGYLNDQALTAPGADLCIKVTLETIERLSRLDLKGLCLPYRGILTGALLSRHLSALKQNARDLLDECAKATEDQISKEEISTAIRESFFLNNSSDPVIELSMKRTYESLVHQLTGDLLPVKANPNHRVVGG